MSLRHKGGPGSLHAAPFGTPAPASVGIVAPAGMTLLGGLTSASGIETTNPTIDHAATVRQMIGLDPCAVVGHRMGLLVRGGAECTRCGARS